MMLGWRTAPEDLSEIVALDNEEWPPVVPPGKLADALLSEGEVRKAAQDLVVMTIDRNEEVVAEEEEETTGSTSCSSSSLPEAQTMARPPCPDLHASTLPRAARA